ncbi:MAG: hypothetical protein FJZ57_03555 [Chlamydiae bacterium]|nr:hypothetical protein [Chlamydiota bacterium]
MPVNIPSTLLKIYTNSTSEDPQETRRIINSLPKNLRNKIHQIIQDSKSITFSQKTQEALGKIALESFESLDKKSKSKTQAIFSRICNQPNAQDSFEASNNVLQKLRALESVTTIK